MEDKGASQQLLNYLFGRHRPPISAQERLVAAIAGSRTLIAELAAISSVLTGEPSMLKAQTDHLLTCDECLARLDPYVEEWLAGVDLASRYPMVAAHLASCPACREQAELLYELLQGESQSAAETPSYLSFERWFQEHHAEEPVAGRAAQTGMWEQVAQGRHRLAAEITVVMEGGKAFFANLVTALTPQLAPATLYRNASTAGGALLELPHAVANLVVKVQLGPVVENMGTVVIEIGTITPPQPIAQARVNLRDDQESLLEAAQSDADGFVIFRQLEAGKYGIQVEHADQVWNFAVTLSGA
jgi:hypothetical protein